MLQSKMRFSGNLLGESTKTDPKTMYITIAGVALFFIIIAVAKRLSYDFLVI